MVTQIGKDVVVSYRTPAQTFSPNGLIGRIAEAPSPYFPPEAQPPLAPARPTDAPILAPNAIYEGDARRLLEEGRRYMGFDAAPEYVDQARARVAAAAQPH